jgi:hypothetical protein
LRAGEAAAVLTVTAAVLAGTGASAHRLDECLQAARIAVEPGRVHLELDLTPGVEAAETIIGEIDGDRDGSLSFDEQQAYARRVLAAIELASDGRRLDLAPGGALSPAAGVFPAVDALRRGEGTIRLRVQTALPPQPAGGHRVFFRNGYRPDLSVYLANALVPQSDRIAVTAQRHDALQRDLTIDYVVRPGRAAPSSGWLLGGVATILTGLLLRPPRRR